MKMSEHLNINEKTSKKKNKVTISEHIDNVKKVFKNLMSSSTETRYKAIKVINSFILYFSLRFHGFR